MSNDTSVLDALLKFNWDVLVCSGDCGPGLQATQQLSQRPPRIALLLQPLVVTVISLFPSNHVIDWPSLRRKSAVESLCSVENER